MERTIGICVAVAACLLVPAIAQAQLPPMPGPVIKVGFDVFQTMSDTEQSFSDCPVPGSKFDDPPRLMGCDPFDGVVELVGAPLGTFDTGTQTITVGDVDTIVKRLAKAEFPAMPVGDQLATVEIELMALNLVSVAPIEVMCASGPTQWSVTVEVDEETRAMRPGTVDGAMTLILEEATGFEGGTAQSTLQVCPRVTFRREDGPARDVVVYPCDPMVDCPIDFDGETTWALSGDPDKTLQFDEGGDNFGKLVFTQPPAPAPARTGRDRGPRNPRQEAGCMPPSDDFCPAIYPHQQATAAHLACVPNPCARDTEAPALLLPAPKTCECTAKGGTPIGDACVTDWLAELVCIDALSSADCGTTLPATHFFDSGCGSGLKHDVPFSAIDTCCNESTGSERLTIADTTGPVVTPGSDDAFCLWPPIGSPYHCFDKVDFMPEIEDVCGDVDDWVFTNCASDQPDDAPGPFDGDTTDD